MYLYHLGGNQILLSKISRDAMMDMQHDGWHLIGIPTDNLDEAKVIYSIVTPQVEVEVDDEGNIIKKFQLCDCLVEHTIGLDYIEEGKNILEQLSSVYPALLK